MKIEQSQNNHKPQNDQPEINEKPWLNTPHLKNLKTKQSGSSPMISARKVQAVESFI